MDVSISVLVFVLTKLLQIYCSFMQQRGLLYLCQTAVHSFCILCNCSASCRGLF